MDFLNLRKLQDADGVFDQSRQRTFKRNLCAMASMHDLGYLTLLAFYSFPFIEFITGVSIRFPHPLYVPIDFTAHSWIVYGMVYIFLCIPLHNLGQLVISSCLLWTHHCLNTSVTNFRFWESCSRKRSTMDRMKISFCLSRAFNVHLSRLKWLLWVSQTSLTSHLSTWVEPIRIFCNCSNKHLYKFWSYSFLMLMIQTQKQNWIRFVTKQKSFSVNSTMTKSKEGGL